jgi:hypothetical protein
MIESCMNNKFPFHHEGWEFEGIQNLEENILKIAHERYKGWRADLSATYKAYNSYPDRMRHKPADLNIVEWHYSCHYFGTKTFKVHFFLQN